MVGAANNVVGLGIKTNTETVKYLFSDGVFLSAINGIVHSNEKCQPGDIIGCRVVLKALKSGDQTLNRLIFSRNGKILNHTIWMEGDLPISVVSIQDTDTEKILDEFELNLGENAFIHNFGKY